MVAWAMASNMFPNLIRYGKPGKKKKEGTRCSGNRKKKPPSPKAIRFSQELNANPTEAELWLYPKWKADFRPSHLLKYHDQYNSPYFNRVIPHILNLGYRYVIEIVGTSFYSDSVQQYHSRNRESYYRKKKFEFFRVQAFNETSYEEVRRKVCAIIEADPQFFVRR